MQYNITSHNMNEWPHVNAGVEFNIMTTMQGAHHLLQLKWTELNWTVHIPKLIKQINIMETQTS